MPGGGILWNILGGLDNSQNSVADSVTSGKDMRTSASSNFDAFSDERKLKQAKLLKGILFSIYFNSLSY